MLNRVLRRPVTEREVARLREKMLSDRDIVPVQVEGLKDLHYALASDAKDLREVSAGRSPRAWQPYDTTKREEVTFLSPLDIVTARERARALFDFDYKWEVYVPLAQRKYGYYALPILWDDAFVARSDLKLDRSSNTLVVCGIWFEDRKTPNNQAFNAALAQGIARLMRFIGATKLDPFAVEPRSVRKLLSSFSVQRKQGSNCGRSRSWGFPLRKQTGLAPHCQTGATALAAHLRGRYFKMVSASVSLS